MPLSARATAAHCSRPRGDSGTSRPPVNRRSRAESVSPCRTVKSLTGFTTRIVYMGAGEMSYLRGVTLLAALALIACGGYRIRPIQLDESAWLQVAADPLLKQVGIGRCTMAVTLNDVPARTL